MIHFCFANNCVLSLCDKALENNFELKQYKLNNQKALYAQKTVFLNYLPQFSFFSGVNYTQHKFDLSYPESTSVYGSISEYLPFGATLQIEPGFYYIKYDQDTNDYESATTISLEYSQSLLPSWINLCIKNPETSLVKNAKKSSDYDLLAKEYQILDSMLALVIQIRNNERQFIMAKYNVELYTTRYEAMNELTKQGNQTKANFFTERQNLLNAKNTLDSITEKRKSLFCELQELIGFTLQEKDMDNLYTQLLNDFSWAINFNHKYWFWNFLYAWDIQFRKSAIQEENLKLTFYLEKQNYAPKLILNLEADYNYEENHSFAANIGFDFSECFSSKNLSLKNDYKKQKAMLQEENEQSKKLLSELLSS